MAIEEPEIHLHPLMLAAVWGVIDGLRAQKLVTTNAGELLAAARLSYLRRLVRGPKGTSAYRVDDEKYSLEEIRKISYHIRLKRDDALFARSWLLVEGETELWLFPEMARLLGCDFATEGIHTVEFAQSGVEPLVKLANDLGIEWHLVADGDEAGRTFASVARAHTTTLHFTIASRCCNSPIWSTACGTAATTTSTTRLPAAARKSLALRARRARRTPVA